MGLQKWEKKKSKDKDVWNNLKPQSHELRMLVSRSQIESRFVLAAMTDSSVSGNNLLEMCIFSFVENVFFAWLESRFCVTWEYM